MCSPIHDPCRLFPGACHEDAAVEDNESEFKEAEGGRPGEFFDKECLYGVNAVMLNWLRGDSYLQSPSKLISGQCILIPSYAAEQDS